jgi:large subunit ribosomal protein L32
MLIYKKRKNIRVKNKKRKKTMAVPKKRKSSSKTKSRHANWVNKAAIQRERAISLAKSVLNENSGSFIYSGNKNSATEEE